MKHLQNININVSNNKLGDIGTKTLAVGLIDLGNLTKLKLVLDGVEVTEKGCHYIGRLISKLPNLIEL